MQRQLKALLGWKQIIPFVLGLCLFVFTPGSSVVAQTALTPNLSQFLPLPTLFNPTTSTETEVGWVYLDGRPIFRISAPVDKLRSRMQEVEHNLRQAQNNYLHSDDELPTVTIQGEDTLPTINVNQFYILTVTHLDAQLQGTEPSVYAETVKQEIAQAFKQAKLERQQPHLLRQGKKAGAIALTVIFLSFLFNLLQKKLQNRSRPPWFSILNPKIPEITTQLTQKQNRNFKAIQRLLFNIAQITVWTAGGLFILYLFPYTRGFQVMIRSLLRSYLFIGIVSLITYIITRLSYILIDRLIETFVEGAELIPQRGKRLHQRVSTISGVTKGITTIILVAIAIFVSLSKLGINIAPLIAGAGLIGVAVSLAAQNIIRDALHGFLILIEDQYAVGDVIVVGSVFGLVENITLRMTQLRDPEERLITIPNSEIKIVCNLSSHHSQADLKIPVAYSADIDQAMDIVEKVTWELVKDPAWQEIILEDPIIHGLDEFNERGMIIRIWIRTQPLKHWDLAREYRRRIKRAFDQAGIALAVSQQEFWVHQRDPKEKFLRKVDQG